MRAGNTWEEDRSGFTARVMDQFDDITKEKKYQEPDIETAYLELLTHMPNISFGDYLKRYIYNKTGMAEAYDGLPFNEVELKDYQITIKESFSDFSVPPSFTSTSAKLSALAKNWLTQRTVRRNVVFLLGFGLSMSVDEVNEALTKWLRERKINPKNAFEVICWYCYAHQYRFPKFEQLYQHYLEIEPSSSIPIWNERTGVAITRVSMIHDDATLLAYVANLKLDEKKRARSVTAQSYFDSMYEDAKSIIAELYNETEANRIEEQVREQWDVMNRNDRLPDYEKLLRVEKIRQGTKHYDPEDISESDFEQILCSAIPKDSNGNLTPAKASSLNEQFTGYRFSRQHIWEIRNEKAEITRFDLLTLKFFIFSHRLDDFANEKKRFYQFLQESDEMLRDCSMGEIYIQNPYECFLLMCMLSEYPLGTYADIVERSYQ